MNEKEVSELLNKLFTPILLCLGFMGNLVSIIIFSKSSLIKHTTFKYLLLLSILDLCVLIVGCGSIFLEVYFNFDIRLIDNVSCKIHSFLVIFFTHSSSMLLVCMSVDRVLVINMKRCSKISNPRIATIVFWILLFAIGILNIHFLLFNSLVERSFENNTNNSTGYKNEPNNVHVKNNQDYLINSTIETNNVIILGANSSLYISKPDIYLECFSDHKQYFAFLINFFPWIDLFFYVIFPSTVMLICSIIIITKIFSTNNRLSAYSNTISRKRTIKNRQISYLLLTTNLVFFLLVSPLLVLNAKGLLENNTIVTTVVYLLNYSNHSLNFIFYGITCQKYRNELFKLINSLRIDKSNLNEQKYELVTSVNEKRRLTTILDQE